MFSILLRFQYNYHLKYGYYSILLTYLLKLSNLKGHPFATLIFILFSITFVQIFNSNTPHCFYLIGLLFLLTTHSRHSPQILIYSFIHSFSAYFFTLSYFFGSFLRPYFDVSLWFILENLLFHRLYLLLLSLCQKHSEQLCLFSFFVFQNFNNDHPIKLNFQFSVLHARFFQRFFYFQNAFIFLFKTTEISLLMSTSYFSFLLIWLFPTLIQ